MDTTEIMNDIERSKIIAFKEDKIMFDAVKKFLLVYLYKHGTAMPGEAVRADLNWALQLAFNAITPSSHGGLPRTNEELGVDLRAVAKGIQIIESGFKELSEFKKAEETVSNDSNPAA